MKKTFAVHTPRKPNHSMKLQKYQNLFFPSAYNSSFQMLAALRALKNSNTSLIQSFRFSQAENSLCIFGIISFFKFNMHQG